MTARALIAGIGNIFFGDDGFGVEVARRMSRGRAPPGAQVRDVGIRGIHLAFELLETPELVVVVDVASRGGDPGQLYVIEPEPPPGVEPGAADAHGMDLPTVLAAVRTMGGSLRRIRLVACEPAELSTGIGLSAAVEAAVEPAIELVHELVDRELAPRPSVPVEEVKDGNDNP